MEGPARVSLISRLIGSRSEPQVDAHPLWQRIVEIAREPDWYARGGIADTVAGRFDAVTLVLSLVMLKMEKDPVLRERIARLAERFVADMDGQLRESGVGDLSVGKHMGKLMSVLGGRIGAYRDALKSRDLAVLGEALERNVTFVEGAKSEHVAAETLALADKLAAIDSASLLAGRIER